MYKYSIHVNAYKPSGEYYSGSDINLGYFDEYLSKLIYDTLEEVRSDLDKYCGLKQGSIKSNNFTVMYIVLDNSDQPICLTGILK